MAAGLEIRPLRPDDDRGGFSCGQADLDRFAEAFVEQLATYSLRRVMTIDDAAQIKAIVQASQRDDYKLRTVIENLVLSDLFRKK